MEASADSFSSAASGTSVNSGTTMTSNGMSGLAMLYHIRVLIPCYKVSSQTGHPACSCFGDPAVSCARCAHVDCVCLLAQEDFEIVQKTLNAIREAALPVGAHLCLRSVRHNPAVLMRLQSTD